MWSFKLGSFDNVGTATPLLRHFRILVFHINFSSACFCLGCSLCGFPFTLEPCEYTIKTKLTSNLHSQYIVCVCPSVFILCLDKYACAHVFGQDKNRAEKMKGKFVRGGRETDKDKGGDKKKERVDSPSLLTGLCQRKLG